MGNTRISHEAIYQYIYAAENSKLCLYKYLAWKRKKRKKKRGRGVHRSRIPQRISIHERPEAVNTRAEFGHWEGDAVEGKRRRNGIHIRELHMETYFADPYSSWQRGTNECHNGVLRRCLPKGADFDTLDEEELRDIVDEINNRPRKCLGWSTPREVFTKLVVFGFRVECRNLNAYELFAIRPKRRLKQKISCGIFYFG